MTVNFSGTIAKGRFAVTSGQRTRSWDLDNGAAVARRDLVTADDAVADLSESGRQLELTTYTTTTNGNVVPTVNVYDASGRGWARRRTFSAVAGPEDPGVGGATSPDARRFVESTNTGMRMYDLGTAKLVWSVSTQSAGAHLWFSADGKTLCTSASHGLSVWSALDGTPRFSVATPNADPLDLVDVAGHLRLAVVDAKGIELTDWPLDVGHLVAAACGEANRNLTATEWKHDVGDFDPYERTCPE